VGRDGRKPVSTAREIIIDALTEIGAIAQGETPDDGVMQLGLGRLQKLIDAWGAEFGTIAVQDRNTFVLTSGTSEFTIGPTGDLVTARPVWIQAVNYVVPGGTSTVEVPMGPMDKDQYAALSIKNLSSGLPQLYYYNATNTNGTMDIWPVVSQNVTLVLYLPRAVDQPVTAGSTVIGPPGYAEAFLYQLAVRLCNPMGRQLTQELRDLSRAAFLRMQRPNADPGILGVDAALTPSSGSAFNILTGNYTGSSN